MFGSSLLFDDVSINCVIVSIYKRKCDFFSDISANIDIISEKNQLANGIISVFNIPGIVSVFFIQTWIMRIRAYYSSCFFISFVFGFFTFRRF